MTKRLRNIGWMFMLSVGCASLAAAATSTGRYAVITVDGALSDWGPADVFYADADITDGLPLASTYSAISLANDTNNLYIGLQLKAPSTIFANWTHSLYIDSDMNPATGFNAGWMTHGYDRLIQYGAGGGVYSVYAFTGGTQAEWAWNFLGTFTYAYDQDRIEWVIPRAMLGGSTEARMLFNTSGGDVGGNPTWAYHTESGAKSYTFAQIPVYTVTVASARGTALPSTGSHTYEFGTVLSPHVEEPATAGGTQYVSLGWAMTGHDPASGAGTSFGMTVTNSATLTWQWQTNVQLTRTASGPGAVNGDGDGFYALGSTVNLTAVPDAGYIFKGWSGDVPAGQTNDNPLALTMDRARSVTANLDVFNGRFTPITLDGSLAEWGGTDLFYSDAEISDGNPLGSTYSAVYVANDHQSVYVGLQLKATSSILSGWTHNLFIDTDLNPATGYSGSMSGGYDYLVQYGAGGGSYSIFGFTGAGSGDWSWTLLGEIGYAFDEDRIEWAIPRSLLAGSTAMKLTFLTEGGSVSQVTWAPDPETGSKIYTVAPTPNYTLTVASARGAPSPAVGAHGYSYGSVLSPEVVEPAPSGGTQYVSLGWTMTGHSPLSGAGTSFGMTVTNSATLTWQWQTKVELTHAARGPGSISGDDEDYYALGSTVNLTPTPDAGYRFAGWSGDVPTGQTNDNPLALTMDRKRNVTANFAGYAGRFLPVTMDGALTEWTAEDVFYDDPEIIDGAPAGSTYESIRVANDADKLYVGAVLKGASSIFANWTHELYIDTDLNPATGFNAGWMSGGYDRLVQYGSGGAVYSIYEFTGAGQGDWSWGYLGAIGYSYIDDIIEWAIPRSALGGSTQARLVFLTTGGDVSGVGGVETWAYHTESLAKVYTFADTPVYTLTVASAWGAPSPAVGSHGYLYGTVLSPAVVAPSPAGGTQQVSLGWTMTGHSPLSGGGTSFGMTVTNHATLTWLWRTEMAFTRAAGVGGQVNGDANGYYEAGSVVTVTAVPDSGYAFAGWTGAVPPGDANDNPLSLTLDRTRSVTATFQREVGRFTTITLNGALGEWEPGDVFYDDSEIVDGAPLGSTYSSISVANDSVFLYAGLQLKGPGSISDGWLHSLYIDTDLNPATGYNAGWMTGGYDRLVQYGGGGGTYSIYSFTGGSQSQWGWAFVSLIEYAFDGDVIEWAIPRSALNGSTEARLEFHTGGGGVSPETWAHHTESSAKTYSFATPDGCVPGFSPRIAALADQTAVALQPLSFTVTANDPWCIAPSLVIVAKPATATFTTEVAGTNRVGTFAWTPGVGEVGTHLLRFVAEDDEGRTTSSVIRVYVAGVGEPINDAGVPQSQTNWAVSIADVEVPGSGEVTVQWSSVSGIPYDVYTSTDAFGAGMNWVKMGNTHEATGAMEDVAVGLNGDRNFIQIVPAGTAPTLKGVWGVMRPTIPTGLSMYAPPLRTDRAFTGLFGAELADAVPQGSYVYIMHAGAEPTWTTLRLNGIGDWVLDSGPAVYTLEPGQGFFLQNAGGETSPAITGPVGNDGGQDLSIAAGYNLIGISEGKNMPAASAFESAEPVGHFDEEQADQVMVLNANGTWRRLIRRPNGTWYDTAYPNSPANTTLSLTPGQTYYYIRRGGNTSVSF